MLYKSINLGAISRNYDRSRQLSKREVFPVVKANAYGCGLKQVVSRLVEDFDIPLFCVSSLDEAKALLRLKLDNDVLIFESPREKLVDHPHIIYSLNHLKELRRFANLKYRRVHLQIDLGHNRSSIKTHQDIEKAISLAKEMNVEIEGIYGHLHSSNEPTAVEYIKQVFAKFKFKYQHMASSETYMIEVGNAIRIGSNLYGDAQTNLDEAINDLSTELEKLENDINIALNDNREVAGDIIVIQDKINGLTMRLNRYEELESQYTADIKRLTFIVDNESIEENGNQEYKCPFCDSHVEGHDHSTYLEASRSELNRIVKYLDDLGTSKQELQDEINSLKNELAELKKEKEEISNLIYKELIPQKKEIKQKLINYQRAIELQNELEVIKKYDTIFDDDLKNLENKVDERRPYKPLQLLLDDFPVKIAENFKEIMTEIHYTPIGDSEFKLDEFEIYFNGQVKRDHGKGNRALFNSVLILALRKYINDLDTPTPHNPHFYFIDSPLHGLMLRSGIEDSLNVRKGFFEYLSSHCEGDQIIVIENTNDHELPEIQENENIKVYQFTEDENNGRYGFLEGIRRN